MIVAGVGALAWAFTVWKWEDPFTATLNYYDQRQLAKSFDRQLEEGRPPGTTPTPVDVRKTLPRSAVKWRRSLKRGRCGRPAAHPAARPERGDRQRHRSPTRSSAARAATWSRGCRARESSSTSRATGRPTARRSPGSTSCARATASSWSCRTGRSSTRSPATGSSSRRRPPCSSRRAIEQLALQACHPRFFASHRYIAYAKPVAVSPPGGGDVDADRRDRSARRAGDSGRGRRLRARPRRRNQHERVCRRRRGRSCATPGR